MTQSKPPIDPDYIKFRDGLRNADDDVADMQRIRYRVGKKAWFTYSREDWALDDIGLPNTPLTFSTDWDTHFPDLYEKILAVYREYGARWPYLVWTWHSGGAWREAIPRKANPSPGIPVPPPVGDIPEPCLTKINWVKELVRRGTLSAAAGDQEIRRIIQECPVQLP